MKRSTLEIICCPNCQADLSLRDEKSNGTVEQGSLVCTQCERIYPIMDSIPHFVDPQDLSGFNRRFAHSYNLISRFYNLTMKITFLAFGGERKARKEILDRLELNNGRLLEVSIGTGMNLPYLFESPDVGEVYGVDISSGQLARCNGLVKKRTWVVDLFLGKAEALPFKSDSFDSVFHIGGINFFTDKKQAIEQMIRVARPGSKIVIADETERLAKLAYRLPGFSELNHDRQADLAVPVHLVPETMEQIQVIDIWLAHGSYHGYCLEFRVPG